ncbi:GntR family transcriptional regulator [Pseudarthrobacter sp. PS3-L1]|uniref:GntR family transcriptional regulator n=1 Tax=Pseudarthrobacter sp. PS3-L1 TaxID=3046207 RepID=UPI0024BB3CC2|nr:GntR family transcriptional regulator [Pseudarthrobacter sp. PS3-L1]MDJ0321244.1 GntR family transcriptional regulator [Pseudarthrobacter sp. PS3-L1]
MSTPALSVDLRAATPPFEQIRLQVATLIELDILAPGSRLPTVRSLAADLGLATGTVARAYKELEAGGYVESRRRSGTIVSANPPSGLPLPEPDVPADVRAAVVHLVVTLRGTDITEESLVNLVRAHLRKDRPRGQR